MTIYSYINSITQLYQSRKSNEKENTINTNKIHSLKLALLLMAYMYANGRQGCLTQ